MSHPDFKHIGHPLTRAQEECAELIGAICKAQRFGLVNGEYDNRAHILAEMADVRESLAALDAWLLSNTGGVRRP